MTERVVSRAAQRSKDSKRSPGILKLLILNHERNATKDLKIFYKVELWK